jgi:Fic family protein
MKILKEIDSLKQEIDSFKLTSKDKKKLDEYFRIPFVYNCNSLSGNSLTETETKIVLEDKIAIGGKRLKDHLEAIGTSNAYDLILKLGKGKTINESTIRKIHKTLYTPVNTRNAGKYRKIQSIEYGKAIPPSPKDVPLLMKEFAAKTPELRERKHPVEYAALLHKELIKIHPFIDGNSRAARLLMNLALLQAGYTVTIIPEILQSEYIFTQDKPLLNLSPKWFVKAKRGVSTSLKSYLELYRILK